ncbi:glycosyltransferase [Janthinobacterium sp. BJB1]|uniref:glycosyltransferase n=1 Tax=Janthinobacterium sp. GW458P TaxID=1981504 RepID=UPI000A326E32|nr:nucleotide disphospho-sugar-binding domain-containing protein [Janthinobacterium sp. GW458P]MBE3024396.1 glycosyltransferase [Janthinobacterium sp. GW458P]PHV15171.1 glycosyltransferase [Janthinobacterium sp. BJB303]PJC98150.1 glycosyltransferase [Janthinobacterium sp. BJB1]
MAADSPPLVIVASSGTGGDMQPFIALARGLRQRGRRVLLLVPGWQEAAAQASMLPYRTFGSAEEGQAMLGNPGLWDERKGWGVVWNGLVPHLGAVRDIVRGLPDGEACVVLCHPILVPMAALARSARPDLRIVAAYLAPSNLCSSHDCLAAGSLRIPAWVPLGWRQALWRMIHRTMIDPLMLPGLNGARARHGLPPEAHFFAHMLAAPDASLGLFPAWFAAPQADWPPHFAQAGFTAAAPDGAAALPPELERFLDEGEPPIVFTPGTGHQHAQRYFCIALEVLRRLGRRGLFLTPHAAQLPQHLPPNVMWQAHAPFAALLPRAAAIVHHGGIGTSADAFRAGIPQLIVPFAYDQFDNGWRARRLGVGEVLLAKRLSAGRMRRQLARLLAAPEVQLACGDVARRMAQGPEAAGLLDRVEAALAARTA